MAESGRVRGANNVKKFEAFIELRNQQDDWQKYITPRKDKLIRLSICEECGFGKSALRQNPSLKNMLEKLEVELFEKGLFRDKSSHEEMIDYPHQADFIHSYELNLRELKEKIENVKGVINLYQSELDKLVN